MAPSGLLRTLRAPRAARMPPPLAPPLPPGPAPSLAGARALLRFDGGRRGGALACGALLSRLAEGDAAAAAAATTPPAAADVAWQRAAWLWPGEAASAAALPLRAPPPPPRPQAHARAQVQAQSQSHWSPASVGGADLGAATLGTNNVAEFVGLLEGLRAAHALGARSLLLQGDSLLVLSLTTRAYAAHRPHLRLLRDAALALLAPFDGRWAARHVERRLNAAADALCARGFALGEWADAEAAAAAAAAAAAGGVGEGGGAGGGTGGGGGGSGGGARRLLAEYERRGGVRSGGVGGAAPPAPGEEAAGPAPAPGAPAEAPLPPELSDVAVVLAPEWLRAGAAAGALGLADGGGGGAGDDGAGTRSFYASLGLDVATRRADDDV